MTAPALRARTAALMVAALCACQGPPLPPDAAALQAELSRRVQAFWRDKHTIRARGFVVLDDGAGQRAEFDWRWTAGRDAGYELAAGSADGDVLVLNARPDGASLWIRPPGSPVARLYRAADAAALREAGPDNPALRALFARLIDSASKFDATARSAPARAIEVDAHEVRLSYTSPGGDARLRLRRADGALQALEIESRAPDLPACIAIELLDQHPPLQRNEGAWPDEWQAKLSACCGGPAIVRARLRIREIDFPDAVVFTAPSGSSRPLAELAADPLWARAARGWPQWPAALPCAER